jgi:hypothetical protein
MKSIYTNRIMGYKVAVSNVEEAVNIVSESLEELKGKVICLTTTNVLLNARDDTSLDFALKNAAILLACDEPIAWIQRLRGFATAEAIKEKEFCSRLRTELNNTGRSDYVSFQDYSEFDETKADPEKLVILVNAPRTFGGKVRFLFGCIKDSFEWQKKAPDEKKDMLIYAHYYYPDVASTGQILTELAEGLNHSFHITVICTVPSYTGKIEKNYKMHQYYYENINGVDVLRIRVPEFRKNYSISRVVNIVAYFVYAIAATMRTGHQDYIYTISQPPVLGGLLGVVGKHIKKAKLIYNIQDFNPEQVMAVSFSKNKAVLNMMMSLDKFSCKQADKVIVVGRDMVDTLRKRFPSGMPNYVHINNWINEGEIVPLNPSDEKVVAFKRKYGIEDKFVIMYSGNIGLYYDLLEIQKIIMEFQYEKDVVFAFVGQGTVLEQMQEYSKTNDQKNIVYIPYQDKADLVYSLNAGDVHFVVNAKGIKGVSVPSKLYGVMAAGKPVLGILEEGSEARLIVEESSCGKVVEPCDYAAIRNIIEFYISHRGDAEIVEMGIRGRKFLEDNLTKDISIKKYADEILKL